MKLVERCKSRLRSEKEAGKYPSEHSSVGRAPDCRGFAQKSGGHRFESGCSEFFSSYSTL